MGNKSLKIAVKVPVYMCECECVCAGKTPHGGLGRETATLGRATLVVVTFI